MRDYCRICLLQFDKRPKAGVAGKYEGHADRPAAREHKTRKQTKKQTIEGTTKQTKKTNTNTHTHTILQPRLYCYHTHEAAA